jgi:2',3'-cyclic-nucleotide 2'-phosphodiesterase (5'-nucleotidase family)
MTNLKKYNGVLKLFVISLTFFLLSSCSKQNYSVIKIEGKQLPVNEKTNTVSSSTPQNPLADEMEDYIKPYRESIQKDLDNVLAYCPETLDKSDGVWQTSIGNLMADVALEKGNIVFQSRENKSIDLCIFNQGGIRAILPKGNVTARNAFEIMPFENSLVVIALKGEQLFELIDYFIATKKPQPLSGLTFTIDKNNKPKNILVQGKSIDKEKSYYVATNDYLANGGDNMEFFKKGIQKYDLDYKIRSILIDYFKEVDTIPVIHDTRISIE